jgi:hypothetical protein
MPPPKDPVKRELWLERQRASHLGQVAHNKGVPCSEEQKNDISIALTGLKQSDETRGKRSKSLKGRFTGEDWSRNGLKDNEITIKRKSDSHKGIVFTEDRCENISISLKGREITWGDKIKDTMIELWKNEDYRNSQLTSFKESGSGFKSGADNINYNGGITEFYNKLRNCDRMGQWIYDVFKRDGFKDVFTGLKSKLLTAHHIKPFKDIVDEYNITTMEAAYECEALWDLNNGISLDWDKSHYYPLHTKYGGNELIIFNLPFYNQYN